MKWRNLLLGLLLVTAFYVPSFVFSAINPSASPAVQGSFNSGIDSFNAGINLKDELIKLPSSAVKPVAGPKQRFVRCKPFPPALSPSFVSSIPTKQQLLTQGITLMSAEGKSLSVPADCAVTSLNTVEIYYKDTGVKQCKVFTESKTATPRCPTAVIDTDKDAIICWNEQGLNPDYSCGFKVASLGDSPGRVPQPVQPVADIDNFNSADLLGSDNPISNAPSSINTGDTYTYSPKTDAPVTTYGTEFPKNDMVPVNSPNYKAVDYWQKDLNVPRDFNKVGDNYAKSKRFAFTQLDSTLSGMQQNSAGKTNLPASSVFDKISFKSIPINTDDISLLSPVKKVTGYFRDSVKSWFTKDSSLDGNISTGSNLSANNVAKTSKTFTVAVSPDNGVNFLQKDTVKVDYNKAVLEKVASQQVVNNALQLAKYRAVSVKENTVCGANEDASRCLIKRIERAQKTAREVFEEELRKSSLSEETVQYYLDVYDGKIDPSERDIPIIETIKKYEESLSDNSDSALGAEENPVGSDENASIYKRAKDKLKATIDELISFLKGK